MPRQNLSAAEAARALGISVDTLRRWDRDGKISVERDAANRRVVSADEVDRLRALGGRLLRESPGYRELLDRISDPKASAKAGATSQ